LIQCDTDNKRSQMSIWERQALIIMATLVLLSVANAVIYG